MSKDRINVIEQVIVNNGLLYLLDIIFESKWTIIGESKITLAIIMTWFSTPKGRKSIIKKLALRKLINNTNIRSISITYPKEFL